MKYWINEKKANDLAMANVANVEIRKAKPSAQSACKLRNIMAIIIGQSIMA